MLVTRIMQSCQSQSELLHGLTQWIERLRDIQEAQRLELIEYTKPETIKLLDFERDLQQAQEEIAQLKLKNESLRGALRSNLPYMRVFRLGAGLFTAALATLVLLLWSGIAIPFHPVFALIALPVSLGFIIMAYLLINGGDDFSFSS